MVCLSHNECRLVAELGSSANSFQRLLWGSRPSKPPILEALKGNTSLQLDISFTSKPAIICGGSYPHKEPDSYKYNKYFADRIEP